MRQDFGWFVESAGCPTASAWLGAKGGGGKSSRVVSPEHLRNGEGDVSAGNGTQGEDSERSQDGDVRKGGHHLNRWTCRSGGPGNWSEAFKTVGGVAWTRSRPGDQTEEGEC